MMRIVIDMQGAQTESRFRGIGRYTMSLSQAILRHSGEHEIILALSGLFPDTIEPIRAAFDGLLPQENIRVWYAPGPVRECEPGNESRREVAEQIREAFLASLSPDVIHICSLLEGYEDDAVTSIGRFDGAALVSVTLYDLIPLLNPDHYLKPNPIFAECYQRKLEYLKRAALYLAISDASRQEGLTHLGLPAGRVVNTLVAMEEYFRPIRVDDTSAALLRQKFGLTRPFVLCAGGSDKRKNLPRLIQAFAALPAPLRAGHHLVLAGRMPEKIVSEFSHQAEMAGLNPGDLRFTGYITDEELVQLYNLCKLFVFPSWHEGFGLPALEGMACGAPVIGAETSSVPEVIGLDAALFDPFDVTAMARKMAQALEDDDFRAALREHGLRQAKKFSWDESAKRAIGAWESLRSERRTNPACRSTGRKPRLAFVSPLPPEHTGIANYSAELLPALVEHYDIDVVVAQDRVDDPWINEHCAIRDVRWLLSHAGDVDRVLYHFGNSPFHRHMFKLLQVIPGVVALHDFFLSDIVGKMETSGIEPNAWTEALYYSHGYTAVRERFRAQDLESVISKYPCNLDVLQRALGLIVHSGYSLDLARQWYGSIQEADLAVIPHIRRPQSNVDRGKAREALGFTDDDFVVCSFGMLYPNKLNDRLLEAWLVSQLSEHNDSYLVFVGENGSRWYGQDLLRGIRDSKASERIRITGWADADTFRRFLAAADVAVQLRTLSRGETSGAVLDCMSHGLATIVNANGTMAELAEEAVWMLPDEFDNAALIEALETLWREPERRRALGARAREVIRTRHAPAECARRYADAIERFHRRAETAAPALLRAIVAQKAFAPNDAELQNLSKTIAATLPLPRRAKRLFLDVSATCRNDLKTGIERVARALILALLDAAPSGYRVEPVYLSDDGGGWRYRYARRYTLSLLGGPTDVLADETVEPECGDVLVGLDLSGDMLTQAEREGLYADYRNRGVMVYFMAHDLLPIVMPDMFPPGADESHAKWLQAVSKFDGAICVSKTVADEFARWQKDARLEWSSRHPFRIAWSHHGADIENTVASRGLPDNAEPTLRWISARSTFLMVGTVEPRKAYLQVLDALTQLWKDGLEINLVIVGKEGWKDLPDDMRRDIPKTVDRLRNHPEVGNRLFWLEGVSDEYLEKVYGASACLIAASYGEGFGLPLIEAAQHKLPIIARDIPVFREVAGEHAFYFNGDDPKELANAIEEWLALHDKNDHPKSDDMPWLTWKESAATLLQRILGEDYPMNGRRSGARRLREDSQRDRPFVEAPCMRQNASMSGDEAVNQLTIKVLQGIPFLKIDVEGAEKDVFQGADFGKIRPWIILLEATLPNSQEECYSDWEPLLLNGGYEYAYFDGLNRYYVAREHENLKAAFKAPPNVFDEFVRSERLESERRAREAEAKAKEVEQRASRAEARAQKAETRARHAEVRAAQAEATLQEVYSGRSWRVTLPLRWLANTARLLRKKAKSSPWLKNVAPRKTSNGLAHAPSMTAPRQLMEQSPRAREIYFQLKGAIKKNRESK